MMTASGSARVLVAEDDVIVARDLEEVLTGHGYEVVETVHSGDEALRTAREGGVDLVLMDVRMPGELDGIEAAERIRDETGVPVVYLTAYSDERTLARATESGPFGYLTKPFTERDLHSTIEIAIHRHRMESLVRESRERYLRLFEDDLVARYVTTPDGKFLTANQAFADLVGAESVDDVLDLSADTLYSEREDRSRFVERVRTEGHLRTNRDFTVRIDGTLVPVLENARGYFDSGGNLTEIHGNLVDMSRERELEEQLRLSSRMEAVRTLAGGLAHDFNNLLSSIRVTAELVLNDEALSDAGEEDLRTIIDACDRASTLVKGLLATGGGTEKAPGAIDIGRSISSLEPVLARILRPTKSLELDLGTEDLIAVARKDQIEQVILNLVINANEALQGKGRVRIHAERIGPKPSDASELRPRDAGWIRIRVSDDGPGIAPDVVERIFDPFFSTKKDGSGLGLAVVYGIVRDHGGDVTVRSERGGGTTFLIHLPAAEAPAAPSSGG